MGQSQEPLALANTSTQYLLATRPWRGCRCFLHSEHAVKPRWEDLTVFCQLSHAEVHLLVGNWLPEHGGGCSQKSPTPHSPSQRLSTPGTSCRQVMPWDEEHEEGPGGHPLSTGIDGDTKRTVSKGGVLRHLPPFPQVKKVTS